ncbi:MAG: SGNH/GDSL hydrolase family protein [Lachnospiraceae bacterium]|nr:SGNH/GDSL hydrolase family protein [Lachnospiraceae bacterium]
MKKRRSIKVPVYGLISIVLIVAGLWLLQRLLMPKYMHGIVEGAMTAEFYQETMNHDVVFVGDCELYENISTVTLWREYGISSYIRGSAQQLIWQSYYLMEDTLRYEKPQVFVFNVLSLKYDTPQKETYNRMTLDGMRWSLSKVDAIKASMLPEESFADYVFPILRYHSRWQELDADDVNYLFHRDKVTHSGYYMRVDVRPAENIPDPRPLGDYEFGENAWRYLDKMRILCEENGVQLILVKAPSLMPHWYDEWEAQVDAYAAKYNLPYYNFLEEPDAYGLDFATDTYDAGLHLNLAGAEKLAGYFGGILSEDFAVPDRRGDAAVAAIWEEKAAAYDAERAQQEARLAAGLPAKE